MSAGGFHSSRWIISNCAISLEVSRKQNQLKPLKWLRWWKKFSSPHISWVNEACARENLMSHGRSSENVCLTISRCGFMGDAWRDSVIKCLGTGAVWMMEKFLSRGFPCSKAFAASNYLCKHQRTKQRFVVARFTSLSVRALSRRPRHEYIIETIVRLCNY